MKLEGKYTFKAPPERLWKLFTGPKYLEQAIPGCERLEEREPGKYDVTMNIGISAVKGTYSGNFELADPEPPKRCRLTCEGVGTPGFVKGESTIEMTQQGDNTIVLYKGEAQVGGLIAGVGQRLISGIAKMLLNQFFANISTLIKGEAPAGGLIAGIGQRLISGIAKMLARFFRNIKKVLKS